MSDKDELRQKAEEAAYRYIKTEYNPHIAEHEFKQNKKDFIAGHASRDAEVEALKREIERLKFIIDEHHKQEAKTK